MLVLVTVLTIVVTNIITAQIHIVYFILITANCTNFYYNYTWVYWTVSVLVFILFFFFFICLCRRRRAAFINQPMLVDNTIMANRNPILDNTSPMYSPNPNYYNGQRNVDNRFNQPYNNQPYNQPGYNQNNVNLVQGKIQ